GARRRGVRSGACACALKISASRLDASVKAPHQTRCGGEGIAQSRRRDARSSNARKFKAQNARFGQTGRGRRKVAARIRQAEELTTLAAPGNGPGSTANGKFPRSTHHSAGTGGGQG